MIADPPYGLKVAEWDQDVYSAEHLSELLKSLTYVNQHQDYHLVIFCEFAVYGTYLGCVKQYYGDAIRHIGPLFPHEPWRYGHGADLSNGVEVCTLCSTEWSQVFH